MINAGDLSSGMALIAVVINLLDHLVSSITIQMRPALVTGLRQTDFSYTKPFPSSWGATPQVTVLPHNSISTTLAHLITHYCWEQQLNE